MHHASAEWIYFLCKHIPISSGTRQHLVDPNNVEWMDTHTNVELIFAAMLDQVFVAANTSGFQSFWAQLFVFIGHQMHTQREILDGGFLSAQIENTDFWVWHTTTEPRFWIRLIFAIAIAVTEKEERKKLTHENTRMIISSQWLLIHWFNSVDSTTSPVRYD